MNQIDLTKQITAFVISAGNNPNYPICLKALQDQTAKVTIDIIKDYSPMSVAFQQMLVRCKTPYYIEVDEDMVLNPDAIETMYRTAINEQDPKVSMVCFRLLDVHVDFKIYGIKIYKFDVFKNYPYNLENMSCEVEQLERMKADGYTYKLIEDVVGQHSPLWSNELIFGRYLNLMEKFKEFKYVWLESLPRKLFEIFQKDPSETNLYALLGAYTSLSNDKKIQSGEKDFTNKQKEYIRMQSFIEQPVSATLYITNRCNLECGFCWRQHKELEDFPDMSTQVIDDLLFRFPSITSLCICGFGEPFLCSNLVQILSYFKHPNEAQRSYGKKLFVGLITNGTLLSKRLHEIYGCEPEYISVSLNASNAEEYIKTTKKDLFDQVLDGIRLSVNSGIPTYLSRVCDKQNIHGVSEFLRLAKALGVKGVHLHNLLPHFDDNENKNFWDMVLTKQDQKIIDDIVAMPESDIITSYPILISKDEVRNGCQMPWKTIGVNGNKSITICNSIAPPMKENGNLNDNIIWQNDYCQKFREAKAGGQCNICKKCFRNWQ
ncbi:MAG: radical SAM protein [Candidatus Cloacimonetes bacterium]|jgi:MoaA/NifB/PqqE/SkfB family radical SAM enzyme|nr:radical SAM protein [Candidatus Cloacimonadota bacterium]